MYTWFHVLQLLFLLVGGVSIRIWDRWGLPDVVGDGGVDHKSDFQNILPFQYLFSARKTRGCTCPSCRLWPTGIAGQVAWICNEVNPRSGWFFSWLSWGWDCISGGGCIGRQDGEVCSPEPGPVCVCQPSLVKSWDHCFFPRGRSLPHWSPRQFS